MISVWILWRLKISETVSISSTPDSEISSSRPTKGDTYAAPALAAKSAWFAVKIRVTLTLIPSAAKTFVAFKPSAVIGILTTILGWIFAISRPSRIIPSASSVVAFTSPLMGPSTIDAISFKVST